MIDRHRGVLSPCATPIRHMRVPAGSWVYFTGTSWHSLPLGWDVDVLRFCLYKATKILSSNLEESSQDLK